MGERVFEAAGYGRQNFQLVQGCLAFAQFSVASNGVTVSNAIHGIAYNGSTSDIVGSNGIVMSFNADFGTTAPNVFLQMGQFNSTAFAVANMIGASSGGFAFGVSVVQGNSTNSNIVVIPAGVTAVGQILIMGYTQTGTKFS